MKETDNFNLSLYEAGDKASLLDGYNKSMGLVDTALKANKDAIASKADASAIGALTNRVNTVESKANENAGRIETVNSNLNTIYPLDSEPTAKSVKGVSSDGVYNAIENLKNNIKPINFIQTNTQAYIGVPEVTSYTTGIVRLDSPGIFFINNKIFLKSTASGSKHINGFSYYISHSNYDEGMFEQSKIYYGHEKFTAGYTDNVNFSSSIIFYLDEELLNKKGTKYIDLLIDLYSYDLVSGDANIPVTVTFNITKIPLL